MQTIQSPVQAQKVSIEKLIQIPVEKVKEKLLHLGSEERIRYAGMLFEGNGWTVAYHRKGQQADSILLSYPKSPDNIVLMVRMDVGTDELSYEAVREHLLYFENELAPQYQCRQFCLIAFNAYESKAEHLEDFNLLLQKWSYIEELHLNYSSDNIREPRIQLFAHNKQTYKKVQRMMQTTNAVAVVQATGTGKSYLIAKLLQDFNGTKRLVMAPSTFIIEQIKEHIRWEVEKIQFMTYAKGMNLSESEIKALQPGLIVLDEFHRCGADEWGRGVQNIINAFPHALKFGTSATPIRYLDNRRDMAKELFEGNIAENLSLAQAITRSILPMPKYVCALYTLKEEANNLRELIKRSRKNEEAKQKILLELDTLSLDWERSNGIPQVLKKHMRKHMSKFIVFCENEKHLLETEPMVVGWFKEALRHAEHSEASHISTNAGDSSLRNPARAGQNDVSIKTYRIYDGEPKSEQILEDFKKTKEKDTLHLLFSINMLNEGLHVNEVSGVVLLRPTASPNIFYQQIGRCLKVGMNHAPVIFDFVNNFKSVRTHDFMYDLQEAKRFFGEVRKEQDLKDLCPEFSIIDEVREITEVFGEIEFKVADWEVMYERLVEFKKRFGHCNVPNEWDEDKTLARWLRNQRKGYKLGLLQKENADRLTELGIEWRSEEILIDPEVKWTRRFNELCEFRKQFGHLNPKRDTKKHKALESFIRLQRHYYKSGNLAEHRIKLLESIGFQWSNYQFEEGRWQEYFDELVVYKTKKGHCNVSMATRSSLAHWVYGQREAFKYNTLDPGRKRLLDNIGFVWIVEKEDKTWEERLEQLRQYHQQHGSALPERNTKENKAVGVWCGAQRIKRKKGLLTEEQIQQLNSLGFKWNVLEEAWEERFAELAAFKEKFGHCRVPQLDKRYRTLATWCGNLRKDYKKGNFRKSLTPENIKRLEALGFSWDMLEEYWQKQYEELKQFSERADLAYLHDKNKSLWGWLTSQREHYRKGALAPDKINLLNKLGIEWSPGKDAWTANYNELLQFKKKHGLSHVPMTKEFKQYDKLALWCAAQRTSYRKNELTPDQLQALQSINFSWTVERKIYTGPRMEVWMATYNKLLKFKEKFGLGYVPLTKEFKDYESLGSWCATQRQHYKNNFLIPEQIQLLTDIGCPLEFEEDWAIRFKELLEYKKKTGSSIVPASARKEYNHLYQWCKKQRQFYHANELLPERQKQLDAIGFPWVYKAVPKKKVAQWNNYYAQLVKYKDKTGSSFVPATDRAQNKTLYHWCKTQRKNNLDKKLDAWQLQKLNDISFPWKVKAGGLHDFTPEWKAKYNLLAVYKEKHGSTYIPTDDTAYETLRNWCAAQRQKYQRKTLKDWQIELLNAINFSWVLPVGGGVDEEQWNIRYAELVQFKKEFGHTRVRKVDSKRKSLYKWLCKQRTYFKKKLLLPHWVEKLQAIGFSFEGNEHHDFQWQTMYNQLIDFKKKHGSFVVPKKTPKLYDWILSQRKAYRDKKLEPERLELLNAIGFPWESNSPFTIHRNL